MSETVNGWRVWPSKNRAGQIVAWNAQRLRMPLALGVPEVAKSWQRYDYVTTATAVELAQLIGAPGKAGNGPPAAA